VTAASLHSTNGDADRTVRTLRRTAIILVPISVTSFVTSAISEAIKQQINAVSTGASRDGSAPAAPQLKPDRLEPG
jgi:hypothetical protein